MGHGFHSNCFLLPEGRPNAACCSACGTPMLRTCDVLRQSTLVNSAKHIRMSVSHQKQYVKTIMKNEIIILIQRNKDCQIIKTKHNKTYNFSKYNLYTILFVRSFFGNDVFKLANQHGLAACFCTLPEVEAQILR